MTSTSCSTVSGLKPSSWNSSAKRVMPHLDVLGHRAAFGRQREAPVLLVIHKAARGQPAHHVGHRRPAEAERGGNVRHAGVAFLVHQLLNPLQVVFRGLRAGLGGPG